MAFITRFIGIQVLFLLLVWAVMAGGRASQYIDLPNILFVLGQILGGALVSFPLGQLVDAIKSVSPASSTERVSAWQRQMRIAVFARLYQLAWGAGLCTALISFIAMLGDLSDPASIGMGMAIALTGPAYGALLAEFVFAPMQQAVMNRPPSEDDPTPPTGEQPATPVPPSSQSGLWKGVTVVSVMLTAFLLPIVSFSEIKKEDAFSPQQEATYLRYLYGDEAPSSQAVSPRLEVSQRQRALERQYILERIIELMPESDIDTRYAILDIVMSIPQSDAIDPDRSHLWRQHLVDELYGHHQQVSIAD